MRSGIKSLLIFAAGIITVAMLPVRAFAFADFLDPVEMSNVVQRQFAKQNLATDLGLYNLSLLNGVSTSAHYRYEAEPSYIDNFYARYDKYSVDASVQPSAWVTSIGGPFSFGLSADTDVVFVRQFKSQKAAITATPYGLNRLPFSAERGLSQLSPGDFISFQTHLTLAVSLQQGIPVAGLISLTGATHALISGEFLVHIYKVDEKHIRIKFIAIHDVGGGTSVGFNINNGITLIALSVADHRLRRVWNIDLGTLSKNYDLSDLYMLDYVLDLTNPRVAAAYDELMQKKAMIKSGEMFYPLAQQIQLQKSLISDFTEFEKIYSEDKSKPKKDRAVDRLFKGSTLIQSVTNALNFKISALRFNYQTFFAKNHISTIDSNENPVYYVFDSFSHSHQRRFPFHIWDRYENLNSNLLFTSNSNFDPDTFVGLFLNREIRTQSLSRSGLDEIKAHLKNTLPPKLFSQIPIGDWDLSKHEGVNVYFKHEIYFSLDAVKALPILDAAALKRRYQDFLGTISDLDVSPTRERRPFQGSISGPYQSDESDNSDESDDETLAQAFDHDLDIISKQISIAFNPKLDVEVRHNAFIKLKNNDLFVETGAGFLIYLLPQDKLNQILGYSLILTGQDLERISFNFGEPTQSELYHSMLYIQDLLSARTVDLRLLQDIEGSNAPANAPSATP